MPIKGVPQTPTVLDEIGEVVRVNSLEEIAVVASKSYEILNVVIGDVDLVSRLTRKTTDP